MVKVAVNGALGRMGTRILNLASRSKDFKIVGAFEHDKNENLGRELGGLLGLSDSLGLKVSKLTARSLKGADVMIDFSSPDGVHASVSAALAVKAALVIGTTGIDAKGMAEIAKASKKIAILLSPNMSVGANFLF